MPRKQPKSTKGLSNRARFKKMASEQTTSADVNSTFAVLQGRGHGVNYGGVRKLTVAGKARSLRDRAGDIRKLLNLRPPKKKK
jgi:hypothetical protein